VWGEKPHIHLNKGVLMPNWLKILLVALSTAVVSILQADNVKSAVFNVKAHIVHVNQK